MNKIRKVVFVSVLFITALSYHSFSQVPGDYGSIASGNWGSASTWGIYNGFDFTSNPAASPPLCADNVWITSPYTVTVEASLKNCNNLDVQAGATLWTGDGTLNGNRYITVCGSSIVCDGTIGNGATYDNISFNIDAANCAITGTGAFDASRIRKEYATNATTNLTIDMNVNLRFNGTSLTQIYNDAANTNFNVTVGSSTASTAILTCVAGNASIDDIDGVQSPLVEKGGSYTINSTMVVGNKIYVQTNNANPTYKNKWTINGTLKTSEIVSSGAAPVVPAGGGAAKDSMVVNSGGSLNITGTNAFSILTTLATTNNNFYVFKEGSTVEYSASGAQTIKTSVDFGTVGINNSESQYYNLIISGSGSKTPSSAMAVRNDITITNSTGAAILSAGTFNISIGGNWTNYNQSGFTEGALTQLVTFFPNAVTLGNNNQIITCPGGEFFNSVNLSKTYATANGKYVQLNNDVTVAKTLTFSSTDSSCMVLNGNTLNITNVNNAAAPWNGIIVSAINNTAGSSNTCRYIISETAVGTALYATNPSKIKWTFGTAATISAATNYNFPFGVSTSSRIPIPVTIGKKVSGTTVDVTIATRHSPGDVSPSDNRPWDDVTAVPQVSVMPSLFVAVNPAADSNTIDRWWEVGASVTPFLIDSIRFSYQGIENTMNPAYQTGAVKAQDWTGSGWDKGVTLPCAYCYSGVTGAGVIGVAVLRSDTLLTYQPWVLTSVTHPLPIKLISFTGKLNDGKVDLNWITASEINNKYFYIERSRDGKVFEDIGIKDGAGNSTVTLYYSFIDGQPYSGLSYYRLRQEDYDGTVSYSELVPILNKDKGAAWYVFPNPATDVIKIANSGSDHLQNATFNLYNPEGTLIKTISLDAKNQSVVKVDISDLAKGVYFGRVTDDFNQQVFKIVKN